MEQINILQKGNIYFLYRPKVQHEEAKNLHDVQRFFLTLKPNHQDNYIVIIIGRKYITEDKAYFAYVETILSNNNELIEYFGPSEYDTSTRGKRKESAARIVAEGKYVLFEHDKHAHFYYIIETPEEMGEIQEEFHIEKESEFLLIVKNPKAYSPKNLGLPKSEKAQFPNNLQGKFQDAQFIPLTDVDFLNYKGTEILFLPNKNNIHNQDKEIQKCTSDIQKEDLIQIFEKMEPAESLVPMFEKDWS